ncbi:MAG: RnfABCDGE type electron transport complex subunit B [Anaerofustis sp.]
MNEILIAALAIGIIGLVLGGGLAYASKVFAVEKDPKIDEVREVLPGANCGGCGFPGCDALADAIVSGKAKLNQCPVGGADVAAKIGVIMGMEVDASVKNVALVSCKGCGDNVTHKFEYYGVKDCREAVIAMGGDKSCAYGCLGYGTCVSVCKFDAIHINDCGIAEVDPKKCTACGACMEACPKNVIRFVPDEKTVHVLCNSHDKGKDVMNVCKVGCIACGLCVKNCPHDAIKIEEGSNLPTIDYAKCVECGVCVEKCPKKTIIMTAKNK